MSYCIKCGHNNPEEASFCMKCGAPINSPDSTAVKSGEFIIKRDNKFVGCAVTIKISLNGKNYLLKSGESVNVPLGPGEYKAEINASGFTTLILKGTITEEMPGASCVIGFDAKGMVAKNCSENITVTQKPHQSSGAKVVGVTLITLFILLSVFIKLVNKTAKEVEAEKGVKAKSETSVSSSAGSTKNTKDQGSKQITNTPKPTNTATPSPTPTFSPVAIEKGEWTVTVTDLWYGKELKRGIYTNKASEGYIYVRVDYSLKHNQPKTKAATFIGSNLYLGEYEFDMKSLSYSIPLYTDLVVETLKSAEFYSVFEVPEDMFNETSTPVFKIGWNSNDFEFELIK